MRMQAGLRHDMACAKSCVATPAEAGAAQATVYMEPQPVVELNNLEAMLSDQVAEEELRILAALSMQVRGFCGASSFRLLAEVISKAHLPA